MADARTTACTTLSTPRGAPVESPSQARGIDEQWLQEWIAFGMLEMAVYLTNHAMFDAYLAKRDRRRKRSSRARNT